MLERRQIVEFARKGEAGVLVTLVRATGSSYRRPGAHLLLGSGSTYAGTVSGGCLEAEVARKAVWLTRNGPVVERYSTLFDDTAEIPYGLGCGGTVDLLFERTNTPEAVALLVAMESSLRGQPSTVLTWLPEEGKPLQRAVFSAEGSVHFASPGLHPAGLGDSPEDCRVYREQLDAPQRLVILGAGDDVRPVAAMAALLGWNVLIADGRAQLARPDRFPGVDPVTLFRTPIACVRDLRLASSDAVVLMTHSYEQDRDCLASLFAAPPNRYLGILGARHRTALLVAEAAAIAGQTVASCCARIHAPVGLDLGGDGPEAIALAIVAEVQAACQGKLPASRRLTPDDVATQLRAGGATRYLQTQCALDGVA